MSLPRRVFEAGRAVLTAAGDSLPQALGAFVSSFVGRPYVAGAAALEGAAGERSAPFACVISTAEDGASAVPAGGPVPITRAAAVIDACEELTLDELRAAYERIADAKRLRQGAGPFRGAGQRTELVGVILARRSQLNLEVIAEEMQCLSGPCSGSGFTDRALPTPFANTV